MTGRIFVLATFATAGALAQDGNVSRPTTYFGMCDASAGVALNSRLFVVANDEDNAIRVYSANHGGSARKSYDVSRFIGVDTRRPESDLEGACRVGNRIYWITSHGQNREGEFRSSRHAFFATRITDRAVLKPIGRAYRSLLADLIADSRLDRFNLREASQRAPKAKGALNIEGLSVTPDGRLLIGFRNPIPDDQALIVPLENPQEVIQNERARFGDPILIDLDGRGIRDITLQGNEYLIIAGSYDGSGKNRLYRWDGSSEPNRIRDIDLGNINAEAIVLYPEGGRGIQLLSDDGTRSIGGEPCKFADPSKRRFRSVFVTTGQ